MRSISPVILGLAFCFNLFLTPGLQAQNITTILGGGDISGNNVPAVMAGLQSTDIVSDPAGNIYFLERNYARLRKITTAGIVVTVAGTGVPGHSGDGGPATAAQLNYPDGLAIDASGNLYISDVASDVIRKVTPAGIITTFAGHAGVPGGSPDGTHVSNSYLADPLGMDFDAAGNLYVAESYYRKITKITPAGFMYMVAGGGIGPDGGPAIGADLPYPTDVKITSSGEMIIANGLQIRRVTTSGIIHTIAGHPFAGPPLMTGDGGPAVNSYLYGSNRVAIDAAGNIFINDINPYYMPVLRKIDVVTGIIDVVRPINGGLTGMNYDNAGNLLIADGTYVSKIDPAGTYTHIAGTGYSSYSGDGGHAMRAACTPTALALDTAGNYYVADWAHQSIRKVNTSDSIVCIAGSSVSTMTSEGSPATNIALGSDPFKQIAVDRSNNMYIASENGVIQITAAGLYYVTANGSSFSYGGDGGLHYLAQYNRPTGVATDSANNIYIADKGNRRVRKINIATGIVTTIAGTGTAGSTGDGGPATAAKFNGPSSLAFDKKQALYVSDGTRIRKIKSNGIISTIAGTGTAGYTGDGGIATAARINAFNIATDKIGNLYFNDADSNVIRKIDTFGFISTVAGIGTAGFSGDGGPATAAEFYTVADMKIDTLGNIYIADTYNGRIRFICGTNNITPTIAVTGPGTSCAGSSVTFSSSYPIAGYGPRQQWKRNGIDITGATGATYTTSTLVNGDVISCALAYDAAAPCATSALATSNNITMTINPVMPSPSGVMISAVPATITFPGETITYTASFLNGGSAPALQWYLNGVLLPGATGATYMSSTVVAGDQVSVTVHTSNQCAFPDSASASFSNSATSTGVVAHTAHANGNIDLYPNPNNGVFKLNGKFDGSIKAIVEVRNMLGIIVYRKDVVLQQGILDEDVDFSTRQPSGVYTLSICTDNKISYYKFMIR